MSSNGHEQRCGSKRAAASQHSHVEAGESGLAGFRANSSWSRRCFWVGGFLPSFAHLKYFSARLFKHSRIPFDTLGISSSNSIQSHLLNKGFHYSPFQLNDIVAKGKKNLKLTSLSAQIVDSSHSLNAENDSSCGFLYQLCFRRLSISFSGNEIFSWRPCSFGRGLNLGLSLNVVLDA